MNEFRSAHRLWESASTSDKLVLRSRLLRVMAHRFEVRLTTVVGAAGFGKTLLLRQADEQNQLTSTGRDVWVGCQSGDSDGVSLGDSILRALAGTTGADKAGGQGAERHDGLAMLDLAKVIAHEVWTAAPFDLAIILDDVHLLETSSSGETLVGHLLEELPANGHLVLSSRSRLPFSLSRLRAGLDLVEIDQDDLAFDDEEFEAFGISRPDSIALREGSPRWPAVTALLADAGAKAAGDFAREEVLISLTDHDVDTLASLALFDHFDDDLLSALSASSPGPDGFLSNLPLVSRSSSGVASLHPFWKKVLGTHPIDRVAALKRGGLHLLERGDLLEAGRAFVLAEDDEGLHRATTALCYRPLTQSWVSDARSLLRLLPPRLAGSGIGQLLSAFAELEMKYHWRAQESFEQAALVLRGEGHFEDEVQALFVASQLCGLREGLPPAPHLYPRACELAEMGLPLAVSMVARFDACVQLMNGDPVAAMGFIKDFAGFGPVRSGMLADQLWNDAGYPEHVGQVTSSAEELQEMIGSGEANMQLSIGLWARGEIPVSVAVPIGLELVELITSQGVSPHAIQVTTTVAIAVLGAHEISVSKRLVAQARNLLDEDLGAQMVCSVDLAQAQICIAEGDMLSATALLEKCLQRSPLNKWPERPYLGVLSSLYVLIPESRELLDSMTVGPALSEVISASRALVAYRDQDDKSGLGHIDWSRIGALRANMALTHLAEIALGAGVDLNSLDIEEDHRASIPRSIVNNLANSGRPVAAMAKAVLATMADGPEFAIALNVLGSIELTRNGALIEDDNWIRRERVRTLCGYLVEHPNALRRDVGGALWPDLDDVKAQSNLRVNLRMLQQVLEPQRPKGAPSWFLESEGPTLNLRSDRVVIDSVSFDELIDQARRADTAGVPAQALQLYERAVELYRGDFLEDRQHDRWAEFERIRYRSAAASAAARVAELLLLRGEPERSMDFASVALHHEPLLERAHRCRIRALLGMENRGAAREAGLLMLVSLAESGLAPEPDSSAILSSLGLQLDPNNHNR